MTTLQNGNLFRFTTVRNLKRGSTGNLRRRKACAVLALCIATAMVAPAQTFTVLAKFNGTAGSPAFGSDLVQGIDGNFYGTTIAGARVSVGRGDGAVYRVTPSGTLSRIYVFNDLNGAIYPQPVLALGTDSNLYGTTEYGGANNAGTVFKVTPAGKLTGLYGDFCSDPNCTDNFPTGLVQSGSGDFYGTTLAGSYGGTIFKLAPDGSLTTLHVFCPLGWESGNCPDGDEPNPPLVQAVDGNFYATTLTGGAYNGGSVFKLTPLGELTTLYSFCPQTGCPDGAFPTTLIQAADGNFYGTTGAGGVSNKLCTLSTCGTVFKITPAGRLTTLHRFCSEPSCSDGTGGGVRRAEKNLVQATDGNFYGTTMFGGVSGHGTAYQITAGGALTTLRSFNGADGEYPISGMMQATDGNFYGITSVDATVYRLSMGLKPFVRFMRSSGKVGQTAQILGQGFSETTSVSFNGTPASFVVKSDTYLTALVPDGATTGLVTVTTTSDTLHSNELFRVAPQILSFSPISGPPGSTVVITGKSLSQAKVLTFDCKSQAGFTVDSDTQITAIVPAGVATGRISVRTTGGRAESTASFNVTD